MDNKKIVCEIYSRISGYMRPVIQWNRGKKEEFSERKYMRVPEFIKYSAGSRNFREFDEKRIIENAKFLSQSGIFDKIINECEM